MTTCNEKAHFLDVKQKEIKKKIMEDMLEGFFGNINTNFKLFDYQSLIDLTFSVLIMLNREILVHSICTFNLEGHRKQLMKDFFEEIRNQVNETIKRVMV